MKIAALVVARNEELYIRETLKSLLKQTVSINPIVLVNDGSTDATPKIGKELGCHVISLPYHSESYVGKPQLANVINAGLSYIKENASPDYILQMGGDHVLPENYVELIVERMGDKIKVASGALKGVRRNKTAALGSGRIVDAHFWDKIGNLNYPFAWGFESWLLYKTEIMGYKTRNYGDIMTEGRPVQMSPKKAYCWGRGMYALGSSPMFALRRCLIFSYISPSHGISMLSGYLKAHIDRDKRLDVSDYVVRRQIKIFLSRIKEFLRGIIRIWK